MKGKTREGAPGRLRGHLTFANVMSVIAVFITLGGSAVAFTLGRNSVTARAIKAGAVRTSEIKNGSVRVADTAPSLGYRCPRGTRYFEAVCIEQQPRPAAMYANAEATCRAAGRNLPTVGELESFRFEPGITLVTGDLGAGEWTSTESVSGPGFQATTVTDDTASAPTQTTLSLQYRCVASPLG